jgi:hypothetical protein
VRQRTKSGKKDEHEHARELAEWYRRRIHACCGATAQNLKAMVSLERPSKRCSTGDAPEYSWRTTLEYSVPEYLLERGTLLYHIMDDVVVCSVVCASGNDKHIHIRISEVCTRL